MQGVGFRPFVYSLATRHSLTGMVGNTSSGVIIEIQGAAEAAQLLRQRDRQVAGLPEQPEVPGKRGRFDFVQINHFSNCDCPTKMRSDQAHPSTDFFIDESMPLISDNCHTSIDKRRFLKNSMHRVEIALRLNQFFKEPLI